MLKIDMLLEGYSSKDFLLRESVVNNTTKNLYDSIMDIGHALRRQDKETQDVLDENESKKRYNKAILELRAALNKLGNVVYTREAEREIERVKKMNPGRAALNKISDLDLYGKATKEPSFTMKMKHYRWLKDLVNHANEEFQGRSDKTNDDLVKDLVKIASDIKRKNISKVGDDSLFDKVVNDIGGGTASKEYNRRVLAKNFIRKDANTNEPEFDALDKKLNAEYKNANARKLNQLRRADNPGKEIEDHVEEVKKVSGKHQGLSQNDKLSQEKIMKELGIKDPKVNNIDDGHGHKADNVKKLVSSWAISNIKPAGQIKLITKKSIGHDGKPIIEVNGNYYIIPKNDLFTTARNGIMCAKDKDGNDNPYKNYVQDCTKDPKYADLRKKINSVQIGL